MLHYIEHEKVIVRFVSLYLLGLVLFFAGWTLSYLVLPEGLIRGLSPLTQMAGDEAAAVFLAVATNSISLNRSQTFRSPSKPVPKQERNLLQPYQSSSWRERPYGKRT